MVTKLKMEEYRSVVEMVEDGDGGEKGGGNWLIW